MYWETERKRQAAVGLLQRTTRNATGQRNTSNHGDAMSKEYLRQRQQSQFNNGVKVAEQPPPQHAHVRQKRHHLSTQKHSSAS